MKCAWRDETAKIRAASEGMQTINALSLG